MSHRIFRLFLASILLIGMVAVERPQTAHAAGPWYVSTTGDDSNDCLSPATPCATLNGAIGKAESGDTISVAEGTYTGTGDGVVSIDKDITLSGGWDADFTVQGGISVIDGEGIRQGISVSGIALVEYFTVQNGTAGLGGGIYNSGTLTFSNGNISNNAATDYVGNYQGGGGIYNIGTVTLSNTSLATNTGYGITNEGTLTINRGLITGNQGYGIAILYGSTAVITNSIVSQNTADGIFNRFTLTLLNSTISNNGGRGIHNWNNINSMVVNSTISANRGGGLLQFSSGNMQLFSSTVTGNSAETGGGILTESGVATLQNSIVAGNTAISGEDCSGVFNSAGYNLIGNSSGCNFVPNTGDQTDVDPHLGLLVGPAGSPGYYPLLSESPAIDAGNPTGCTDQDGISLSTDQRGAERDNLCDIGAYEFTASGPAASLVVAGGDHQSGATASAFPLLLRVAVLDGLGSPVSGVTVEFVAPESGPSGTFADTGTNSVSVVSGEDGVAPSSTFTANDQEGAYQITASAAGLEDVNFHLAQVERPANDGFANAEPITSLPFNVIADISKASIEPDENLSLCTTMQRSVWYVFTPSITMTVGVNLQGGSVSGAMGGIYAAVGPGVGGLSPQRCIYSTEPTGYVQLSEGQVYYIQLGSYTSEVGTIQLGLEQILTPPNDNFNDANLIDTLPFSMSTSLQLASVEADEPQPCYFMDRSIWYVFTPTQDMIVQADLQGSSLYYKNVNIYRSTGSGMQGLEFLTCSIFNQDLAVFSVEAGQTYYLQAGNAFGDVGALTLNVRQLIPPLNDNFADAAEITSLPFSTNTEITGAGVEPGEPTHCGTLSKTVWFRFTPGEDVSVRIDAAGTTISYGVAVFRSTGAGISDLEFQTCATGNFQASAGETYYIQAGATAPWAGTIQLNLRQIFPPPNDTFTNAQPITSVPFGTTVDITDAWTQSNEPQYCTFMNRTIWYAFVPTEDMAVRVRTPNSGSNGDNLTVYRSQGTGLADQVFMGCTSNNGQFTFLAQAGETYYLQVGNTNAPIDTVQFDLVQLNPPANDNFANAEPIDTLPFSTLVQRPTDATLESEEQQWCYFMEWTAWYAFTPMETTVLTASTEGSSASSNINVYRDVGSGLSGLNVLGCTALDGPVTFVAEAGQTYYLQAGTVFGEIGDVRVNLDRPTPPANDYFADAETIGSLPVDLTLDIRGAGTETGEPQFCSNNDKTAWYTFTASEDMFIALSTQGTGFDHNVGIYQANGTTISDLQFLTCIGSAGGAFHVQAGETYFLQAGAIFAGLGNYQLRLTQVFPPANDNFADAIDITTLPFSNSADLTDAFTELGEPQFCYSTTTTVWYSFTPTATTRVRLSSEGGSLLPNVNVFRATGSGFENLQALLCSGGSEASFLAAAGETYYFQVGGFGEDGTAQFNLEEIPAILGRITDSVTGDPLSGNESPFAVAVLYQVCGDGCLNSVAQQGADDNGLIYFDGVSFGTPLPPGEYVIEAIASQYIRMQFGPFTFTGSRLYVGDLPIDPPSVIRGRAVDAESGMPLLGTYVYLRRCDMDGCSEYVNEQSVDGDGLFHFNSFYYGAPLSAGTYELEFAANQFQPKKIQVTIANGENRDLGDVLIEPFGAIGSISGRVVDALTGSPIPEGAGPTAVLYRCDPDCSPVNGMSLGADGRFRFENDYDGNRLLPGAYKVSAVADQYETHMTESFEVTDEEHKDIGDVELPSYPVRFSELQACEDIPAAGGECSFRVRITNGTNQWMIGRAWSIVYAEMPGTVFGYTKFEARDAQFVGLRPGGSRTFRFKFDVPANTNPEGSLICTRIYVGQGLIGPSLNPVGVWEAFCIVRNGADYEIASPEDAISAVQSTVTLEATATESEPNNSCQNAQDVGAFTDTLVLDGILDSSEAPDVDFYRFSAAPGELVTIDLEGQATGKGTLGDPLLGFFDSNCNLVALNDDSGSLNSRLELAVPDDGIFIMAATFYPDSGFNGGGNGSYQLTLSPVKTIASISGTATDAVTGKVLRGDVAPFAYVYLSRCGPFGCPIVNSVQADSAGRFRFEADSSGAPLRVGEYSLFIIADQYEPGETGNFTVAEGQDYDAGNVPLQSYPIRFSDVKACSVPSEGGICDFSVRVSNGLSTRFTGRAWSIIEASGMGSFIEFTEFQTDTWQDLDLRPGRSTVLRFRFLVRGSVDDGATICATTFAGQKPSPFFGTAGQRFLFCIQKGMDGFSLMSPSKTHEMQRQMELQPLSEPGTVIEKPK